MGHSLLLPIFTPVDTKLLMEKKAATPTSYVTMTLFLPISSELSFNSKKPHLFTFINDLGFLIIGIFYYFPLDSYVIDQELSMLNLFLVESITS